MAAVSSFSAHLLRQARLQKTLGLFGLALTFSAIERGLSQNTVHTH
jgi:hypothetical protein